MPSNGLHPTEVPPNPPAPADDDEDDFMSDKFLVDASKATSSTSAKAPQTYFERRRQAQLRSEDRGRTKSRAEREKEAREEALAKDLITDADGIGLDGEGESKAVKMMRKMGFTPGQALGVKRAAPGDDQGKKEATTAAAEQASQAVASPNAVSDATEHRGLGARPTPPPQPLKDDRRTVPIGIHLRGPGRSGLGVPGTSAPPRPTPLAHLAGAFSALASSAASPTSANEFLDAARQRFSGRKVEGFLRRARRTCEELDRRKGVEDSVLWLDPDEERREEDRRLRRRMEDGEALVLDDGAEPVGVGRQSRLAKLAGREEGWLRTVVDLDDEEGGKKEEVQEPGTKEEREMWTALDAGTRLALTLEYLRREHWYCLWCGAQYDSPEQLAEQCPGEDEDDH